MAKSFEGDASVVERVDVVLVDLEDLGVVCDRFMVVSELRVAVSPVIEGLDVVLRSKLDFVRIIVDRSFKSLEFSVNKASVRVNYRVLAVEGDGLVEIEDCVLELTGVTVTAGTVVPVNCVRLVKLNCCSEVCDRIFEF